MTSLILVRHGETTWHEGNRYCGSSDVPLSPRGVEQAETLARWAATAGLAALWVSPLIRAQQTAAPVTRTTGLTARTDSRLRELDFGQGEGKTASEMEAAFPEAWAAFQHDPVRHHLPGGEDPYDAVARAMAAFHEIVSLHPAERVLVVMHTTLIRLCLCRWLRLPLSDYRRLFSSLRNGSLTEVKFDGNHFSLSGFNTPLTP